MYCKPSRRVRKVCSSCQACDGSEFRWDSHSFDLQENIPYQCPTPWFLGDCRFQKSLVLWQIIFAYVVVKIHSLFSGKRHFALRRNGKRRRLSFSLAFVSSFSLGLISKGGHTRGGGGEGMR